MIFSIILLPFSLIHEIGHFISALFIYPSSSIQMKISINNDGLVCSCIEMARFTANWKSIILLLSGSVAVILFVIVSLVILRNSTSRNLKYIKYYLLFGLLSDIPNLFPLFPVEGTVSDGFRTWILLQELIHLPQATIQFSMLLTFFSSITIFFASYCLGSGLLDFILALKNDSRADSSYK